MKDILKKRLKCRFKRSLAYYDQAAVVQTEMAQRLLCCLKSLSLSFSRILEIGAGTGLFTKRALEVWKPKFYLATDLVADCGLFIEKRKSCYFIAADGEDLSWLRASFDLIVSNATFQWFLNLPQAFKRFYNLLVPGGILAFTTFGPLTMWEIIESSSSRSHLISEEAIFDMAGDLFRPIYEESWLTRLYFSSPREVLAHIRATGALGFLDTEWSLVRIKAWAQRYETFREVSGLPLTYQPFLFIWEKR